MRSSGSYFWMVWCENGGSPTDRHTSRLSADREATRLANSEPGRRFYVLKALAVAQLQQAVLTVLDENPEPPF